jgi:hypothetical protein
MILKKQVRILDFDAYITFKKYEPLFLGAGFQRFNIKATLEIDFITKPLRIFLYSARGSWYIQSTGSVRYGGEQRFYQLTLLEAKVQIMKILTDPRK